MGRERVTKEDRGRFEGGWEELKRRVRKISERVFPGLRPQGGLVNLGARAELQ